MRDNSIRHMVLFNLKHKPETPLLKEFLDDGNKLLSAIPGVRNFEVCIQISPKSQFKYLFSMEFDNQEAYNVYNKHPVHVDFVKQRWFREVTSFMEIDLTKY